MKNFVFFQNCVSPHQMPYIEALSKREDVEHVWVIAPRLAYNERAAMGWPSTWTTSTDKLRILVSPADEDVKGILDVVSRGCNCCLFSGITAFPEVEHWMKISLGYDVKRGIITEGPYVYDKPLWLHKIRFVLKDLRYVKYFDYVFAIGEDCEHYYKGWSRRWKVVPFLYCTEWITIREQIKENRDSLNICFVGSIDKRKNLQVLLNSIGLLKNCSLNLTVVGDGTERRAAEKLAEKVKAHDHKIFFVGAKTMSEAQQIIAGNDVLVLPSLHDGWGAVINEAMTLGTIPVCSNRCGAKSLIQASGFGGVFNVGHSEKLAQLLEKYFSDKESLRSQRTKIMEWAERNIAPQAVADRFVAAFVKMI